MPTYTNPNSYPYTEGGVTIDAGETKTTPKTLTEMEITLPSAVAGLGLELVTEAVTGETARIYWIDGAKIGLVEVSGAFDGEKALTADVTGALGTPAAGADVVLLTRDTATNFYSALLDQQTITAAAAGDEEVYLHRGGTWIAILAGDVGVNIKSGTSGDEIFNLQSGLWCDRNDQRYQHLTLTFAEAGSVEVYEFDCDFNPLAFSDFAGGGALVGGVLADTVDTVQGAQNVIVLNPDHAQTSGPVTIVDSGSPQTLTAAWADCGSEIDLSECAYLLVWIVIDVNDSSGIRLRLKAKHTAAGAEEFDFSIETESASAVAIEDKYYEFTDDADQLKVISIPTWNGVPYGQLQVMAGTLGAGTDGQIDALYITKGY